MRSAPAAAVVVVSILLAAGASGCKIGNAYFVRDTEGGRYRVSCAGSDCEREAESPYNSRPSFACAGGAHAGFVLAGRRVIVACSACVGPGAPRVDEEQCRPLRCERDVDCPPRHAGAPTRCARGLCQVPSQPEVDFAAASGLCMAGAGRVGARAAAREQRMSMARAACDPSGRCAVPGGCRQP